MGDDNSRQDLANLSLRRLVEISDELDLIDGHEETVRGFTIFMGDEGIQLSHTYAHAFLQGVIHAHRRGRAQQDDAPALPPTVRLAV